MDEYMFYNRIFALYKIDISEIECVKEENKAMFYHSQGFRLRFWGTNNTNVLKC